MKQELISIVVPIYNTDSYLEKCIKSIISGSLAALVKIVVPLANTDAKIKFSVAPTLGKEKAILQPIKPLPQSHFNLPCLSFIFNPICLNESI